MFDPVMTDQADTEQKQPKDDLSDIKERLERLHKYRTDEDVRYDSDLQDMAGKFFGLSPLGKQRVFLSMVSLIMKLMTQLKRVKPDPKLKEACDQLMEILSEMPPL